MRRARIGLLTCSWSVLVFVMAIAALLVSSAGAFAQDQPANWSLADQQLKIAVHGSEKTISANAILAATDANGAIFKGGNADKDGAIKVGAQFGKFLNKNIAAKPIMANIVPNANLFMAAVIQGVSSDYVTQIVNGRSSMYDTANSAAAEILANVTAQFSQELFALDSTNANIQAALSVAGLQPNAVTGVGELSTWGISSVVNKSATSVLVLWYYNDLVTGATDPEVAKNNALQGKVYIAGADKGSSNFVGMELPGKTGPALYVADQVKSITYAEAWDTTMNPLNNSGTEWVNLFGNTTVNPLITSSKFQFRTKDVMDIRAYINQRGDYDGEPDTYFGANSDSLVLAANENYNTFDPSKFTQFTSVENEITTTAAKVESVTGTFTVSMTLDSDGSGGILDWPNALVQFNTASGDVIVNVSGMVDENLLTVGDYETFAVNFQISDEFVENATNQWLRDTSKSSSASNVVSSVNAKLDTAPPFVSTIAVKSAADGSDEIKQGQYARAVLEIDANGDDANAPGDWLNANVAPYWTNYNKTNPGAVGGWSTVGWLSTRYAGSLSSSDYIRASSIAKVIPKVVNTTPGSAPQTIGSELTVDLYATSSGTLLNAGMVFQVSDDARNAARTNLANGFFNTVDGFKSIADDDYLTNALFRDIASATVCLDNNKPAIALVRYGATNLPSDFVVDKDNTADYLRYTYETQAAAANAGVNFGAANIYNASRSVILIPRGTAKISGSDSQNGSPVAAVVEFNLSNSNPEDNDSYIGDGQVMSEFFFKYSESNFSGWSSSKYFKKRSSDSDNYGWSLIGSPVITGTAPSRIAHVTFAYSALPELANPGTSINSALNVTVMDDLDNTSVAQNSTALLVDVNRPAPYGVGDSGLLSTLLAGATAPANTILAVTDAKDKTKAGVLQTLNASGLDALSKSGAAAATANATPFINSTYTGWAAKTTEVKAGYMIIVSASFSEPNALNNSIAGSASNVFFPYLLGGISGGNKLDAAGNLFGTKFKTIAADFSDFVVGAKEVLPDVTAISGSNNYVADAAAGDVIDATWVYYVDPTANLAALDGVRAVTLAARDLSGNIKRMRVNVGTADFIGLAPSVLSYRIYSDITNAQGYTSAVLQGAGAPSAYEISAATYNYNKGNEKLLLVVQIGNFETLGGDFDLTDLTNRYPITADLTAFGGSKYTKPDSTDGVKVVRGDGTSSTNIADATAKDITFATFTFTTKEIGGLEAKVSASSGNAVIVSVTGKNLVSKSVTTSKMDVDTKRPVIVHPNLLGGNLSIVEKGYVAGDNPNDNMVRPGETLQVAARINGDGFLGKTSDYDVRLDGSAFGLSKTLTPDTDVVNKAIVSGGVYYATWTFQVDGVSQIPSTTGKVIANATDQALNFGSKDSNTVIIDKIAPSADSIILSVSDTIRYATDQIVTLTPGWYEIGLTNSLGAYTPNATNNSKSNFAVGIGNGVRVVAKFAVNDPVFTTLDWVHGDFSAFNGQSDVIADATSASGGIVTATWTVWVSASVPSNQVAQATLWAIDKTGLRSANAYTHPIIVDTQKPTPDANNKVTYKKHGPVVEANELGKGNNNLTADLTNSASFEFTLVYSFEEGAFSAANSKRYPGAMLWANKANLLVLNPGVVRADDNAAGDYADNRLKKISPVLNIDASELGLSNNLEPDSWTLTGDGPTVDSASAWTIIRWSTNTVLTVKKSFQASTTILNTVASKKDASLKVSVTDPEGNVLVDRPNPIELDLTGPTFGSNNITGVTLTVESGPVYPAYYTASGTVVRPTRVARGTVMAGQINVKDAPDFSDPFKLGIWTNDFAGGYQYKTITPANGDDTLQSVTFAFTIGSAPNSFPIPGGNNADIFNGLDTAYQANGEARVVVDASDTVSNKSVGYSSPLYEVDNEGPKVIKYAFAATTEVKAKNLTDVPALPAQASVGGYVINAVPSQWLVWAAKVVVDGTEEEHFQNFGLDWYSKVGSDYEDRLVAGSESHGYTVLVASPTRTVLFVTSTVQIAMDALPMDKVNVVATMDDALGNNTKVNNDQLASDVQWISINAIGPKATEITLIVDGQSELTTNITNLGIGKSIDSVSSMFEVGAGANIVVAATITTVDNNVPRDISIDLSQLFPAGIAQAVTRVVPSRAFITPQGNAYAEWQTIAYNFDGSHVGIANNISAAIVGQPTFSVNGNSIAQYVSLATTVVGHDADWMNYDIYHAAAASRDANFADTVKNLSGLPYIQVQRGAAPANIASVTVRVFDASTMFPAELSVSDVFTVDTLSPKSQYWYDVTSRSLQPSVVFTSGPRAGFPFAPNLDEYKPDSVNRVRGGDTLNVIGTIVNPLIDGSGDDYFRSLTDGSVFGISNAALSVTADLSSLNETITNAVAVEDGNPYVMTYQSNAGAPSTIAVTFPVTISSNLGVKTETSDDPAFVKLGIQDDARNLAIDNPFEVHNIDYVGAKNLAVDNTPPSISGKVDMMILSGSATTTGTVPVVLGPGQIVPAGSIIAPGAVLSVSITVTDGVDHPIDVLNNPNYGLVSLSAKNIALPASNIQIVTEVAKFIVPDSAEVPFTVQIPSAQEGFSTANLFFIIDATDTIGNTASKNSNSTFQYDANPVVVVQMDGTDVTVPDTFTVHAGQGDVEFNAKTFDVGGVTKVEWLVDGTAPDGVTLSDPLFTELATPQRDVDWPVTVSSQILPFGSVLAGDQIVMNAQVTDKDASVTTSGAVNVVFNQPALFAEFFDFAAGAIVDATLEAPENGLNAAGVDVREVTISEGDVLDIVIEAADANGDPVFLVAGGTAFATDAMLDSVSIATGEMAGPTAALQIVPGYLAVTGDAQSATFTVELSAVDQPASGKPYPEADNVTILVNVLAKSSKPVVTVQSMTVDGVEVPYDGSVIVPEGQTLVAVVQAVDPGQEDLFFSIDAPEYILNGNVSLEESATSYIKTVTMTYTPGMEDSDIIDALVPVDNPWDPFIAAMTFSNSNASTTENVEVDIENVSQPPVATVTYSLNGALPVPIQSGEIIPNVPAGSVIVFYYAATDPDGKLTYLMPGTQGISVTPASFATTFGDRILEIPRIRVEVTVKVPGEVVAGESDAVVTYVAVDQDGSSTTSVFTIQASPTTTPQADEIVFAAGVGGSQVNVKNFDKYNGNLFDLKNAFWGMPPTFLPVAGGGENRETYVSLGDIDANNTPDIVVSFGSLTADTTVEDVTYPNVLYVREKTYDQGVWKYTVIENSAIDPFYGTDPTKPVFYNKGDVKTAIGNFIGAHPNQVVAVQGRGGNGVLRLLQWNGTAWSVKAQFNALEDNVNGANLNALSKNLTGEINIAAADFNGDGIAELVAGQGNSASSETIVQVVQFERTEGVGMAGVANRVEFTAFESAWQGEGGVKVAAADLNGDGKDELIVSTTGQEDNWTKSIIAIYSPTVVEGMLTGFVKVSGEMGTFSNEVNPSGVINIAAGELDGNATTGQELIVATGALMEADGITPVVTAPVNKFRVVKPQFNGLIYTSYTRVMIDMGAYMANLGQDAGWQVFHGEWAPTSGALNVASGEDIYKAGLVY